MNNELLNDSPKRIITGSTLIKVGEQYYETKVLYLNDFTIDGFDTTDKKKDFKIKN